ncbi:MAG: hypothetical protein EI684_01015, partial [Candidatus Viridilinea halotolerans]
LATFALLFHLLPGLPDRGYSLAKSLGLLLVAYVAWLAGSLGTDVGIPGAGNVNGFGWGPFPLAFTPATLWLFAGPLLAAGALAAWWSRAALRTFWRERAQALLGAEVVFLGFLLLGIGLRWLNPDLWHPARGGEKPMDFAYLNAVLKSGAFPPYDPWHAGGYLNYYYFGFVLVGALTHLSGVLPSSAYNLAVATVMALTAVGAWGVVYNLLAKSHGERVREGSAREHGSLVSPNRLQNSERLALVAGGLAPVLLLLLGNLAQAIWYLSGYAQAQGPKGRPEWAYWDATRIVNGTVNEFPFFTFLFGDLHAHMLVMPLSLALLGLAVAYARDPLHRMVQRGNPHPPAPLRQAAPELVEGQGTASLTTFMGGQEMYAPQRKSATGVQEIALPFSLAYNVGKGEGRGGDDARTRKGHPGHRQNLSVASSLKVLRLGFYLLALGLLAGAVRATNTWDYPTFVGLTALIMAGAAWRAGRGQRPWPWHLLWMAGPPLLVVVLGNLLFLPFTAAFATESSGVELWREGAATGVLAQVLAAPRTTLWELTLLAGHWVALVATLGMLLARRLWGDATALLLTGALTIIYLAGIALAWPALVLILPLLLLAVILLWRLRRAPYHLLLPGIWLAGGLGLLVLVEVVAVKGDIGRMNTVFKFGLHAWMLFALGGAALLPQLWLGAGRLALPAPLTTTIRLGLALLLLAALIYPLTATPARATDRWATDAPRSLDGAAFMTWIGAAGHGQRFALDEDAAAIAWLQRNVTGTPVLLEAHQPSYQWAGRVASHTGLPTLLGWEWHQVQQRNVVGAGPAIRYRQQIIEVIYNSLEAETSLEMLRRYGVEYIYVGGFEREIYAASGLAKFPALADAGVLEEVFAQGQTAIYRMVHPGTPQMLTSDRALVAPTLATPPPLLLDGAVNRLPAVDEYGWAGRLGQHSVAATLLWLLAFYGLALLGLPLAHIIFGHWPDGGVAWARLIGLLLLGYAVWLPTSLGIWHYDRWGVLGGVVLVGLLNVGVVWGGARTRRRGDAETRGGADAETRSGGDAETRRREEAGNWEGDGEAPGRSRALFATMKTRWRGMLASEMLFLLGFGALALVRAFNPDLWHPVWGGEKPMEFGFLNAILRSAVMPPYDPFFSGGYINYYYYGFFLLSLPIKLTGIAPAIGFNLAVATIGGLTLAGAFALVLALTQRLRYGLLGAGFVVVAGNVAATVAAGWAQGLAPVITALREAGLSGMGARLDSWYVGPTRVIPYTINEFPAFSFLFADLHPHLIALPMTLLVVALGYVVVERGHHLDVIMTTTCSYGLARRPRRPRRPRRKALALSSMSDLRVLRSLRFLRGKTKEPLPAERIPPTLWERGPEGEGHHGHAGHSRNILLLSLLALTLGAVAITNAWDFPSYGLLVGLACLGAAWRSGGPRGRGVPLAALFQAGLLAAGVGLAALMLYAPFFDHYWAPVGGIGMVAWDGATRISAFLLLYGIFVALLLPLLAGALWRVVQMRVGGRDSAALSPSPTTWERGPGGEGHPEHSASLSAHEMPQGRARSLLLAQQAPWLAVGLLLLVLLVALLVPVLGLRLVLVAMLLTGLLLLGQRALHPATWYALLLAWLAWALALGTELIYIRDHLDGGDWYRMNTVFKFGLHVWVLLGLAAAALLPLGLRGLRRRGGPWAQRVALGGVVILVGLAAVYPLAATPARIANRFAVETGLTLDGLAFMQQAGFIYDCQAFGGCEPGKTQVAIDLRGDAAAIAWLNETMRGTPIVVQSNHFFYRAYGIRIAANTGLPTVVSALHVNEQRDPATAARRDRDVEQFYRTSDQEQALRFLAHYGVNYVYVGGVERALYPQAGLEKFALMSERYLDAIYTTPEVQIYAVRGIPEQYARPVPFNFDGQAAPPLPVQPSDEAVPRDLAELEAANRIDPTHGPTAFGVAERYRRLGRLDDAARVLEPAARAKPSDIGVIHLWGDILAEAGRFSEAEDAYMLAAQAQPTAGNWNKLGTALVDWGELDKAALALGNALVADPQEPDVYYQIGRLFALRGDRAEAIDALQNYLRLAPEGRWAGAARELLEELGE